jgi:Dolichyl-phosphate-mannose-protein mannosyltransferase
VSGRGRGLVPSSFTALVAALIVVGCLRPVLPPLVLDRWAGVVVVLALVAAVARLRRDRLDRFPRENILLALLPLSLAALYLQPQRVASDGIFYFAPLRSVVVDHDLDFENEYRVLGAGPGYFQRTPTGRLPDNYSIGPALVWLPAFLAAHLLALLGLYRPTGFGYPYFTAIATTSALAGFLGVVLVYRLLRAYFEDRVALAASILVWLGTFHAWYMIFEPSMSHALAMATVAAFLLLTHRGIRGERAFFVAGLAGGLVALVRWQNVVLLPVALVPILARGEGRPGARKLAFGAAGFLLAFAPQLLFWKAIYGSFLLVPQGGGYIDWTSPRIQEVLFSSRHGLFSWAPVLWLALTGIPAFVRRAPALGFPLVGSALAALYVNASVTDWWAGASFGSRRFDSALPLFALGLGCTIEWLVPRISRHPFATATLALAPFVVWNFLLMGVYFSGAIPPDGPASFRQAAADGIELVYRVTGYPFSWPGAIRDQVGQGIPLPVYDLSGSLSLSRNVEIRMGDTDALFLGRGWSLPRRGRESTWRETAPSGGEVFVALVEPAPYRLILSPRADGMVDAAQVQVQVNDFPLDEGEPLEGGRVGFDVAAADVRAGINRLVLRGRGGQSLGICRIRLERPGEIDP